MQGETIDLEALLERQSRTLTAAAHELKAPLSLIRMYAARLNEEGLSDAQRQQYHNRLLFTAEQMLHLSEGLIEGYRWGQGRLPLEPVNTTLICEETCHELSTAARELNQSLIFQSPRRANIAVGHPLLLKNVLFNIIFNALKHTPARTQINVAVNRHAGQALVSVIDSGPGFEKHTIDRINRAQHDRLQAATARTGSGLGLAVARQLMQAMDGRLQLKRSPRGGYCLVTLRSSQQLTLVQGVDG